MKVQKKNPNGDILILKQNNQHFPKYPLKIESSGFDLDVKNANQIGFIQPDLDLLIQKTRKTQYIQSSSKIENSETQKNISQLTNVYQIPQEKINQFNPEGSRKKKFQNKAMNQNIQQPQVNSTSVQTSKNDISIFQTLSNSFPFQISKFSTNNHSNQISPAQNSIIHEDLNKISEKQNIVQLIDNTTVSQTYKIKSSQQIPQKNVQSSNYSQKRSK